MAITALTQRTLTIAAPDSGDIVNPYGADAIARVSREDGQPVSGMLTAVSLTTAVDPGPPPRAAIPLYLLDNDAQAVVVPAVFRVSGPIDPADDPVLVTIVHRYATPVAGEL
jgi:hypothetical protein